MFVEIHQFLLICKYVKLFNLNNITMQSDHYSYIGRIE